MTSPKNNASLALSLVAFVAGMVMLAYASVPLYRLFCQATGFGGTAQKIAQAAHPIQDRMVTVRFDANVNRELNWSFKPSVTQVKVRLGEEKHIQYIAENRNEAPTTGRASFNISPTKAGGYFDKIQCFCFTEQTLAPHEIKPMDVTFYIDPLMLKNHDLDDVSTMTLSYTFFPAK